MAIILGETGRNDVCLRLGKQGEHDVTFFEFDFSLWAAKYGDGVLSLRLTPNGSATAYPVTLDFDGTTATYTVTATDTATAGLGSAELVYIVGDDEKLKKSVSYVTSVEPSDDTGEAPEPYDEWLAHLEVLAGETSQAKTDAETAASEAKASEQAAAASEQNAKTSENNAKEYADRIADLTVTAHEATGETPTVIKTIVNDVYNLDFGLVPGKDGKDGQDGADGVGIASVALNSDYTLTITLTDGTTYTTTSIRGEQGETGATPDFTIGTVTTLAPGSQATATITGTDEEPVLNLGIPKGDPGDASSTGYYPDLYAGGLVTDKGETDTAPYTFRASKSLGYRESLNQIVGATVGWNQIVENGDFSSGLSGWTASGATASVSSGEVTLTATGSNVYFYRQIAQKVTGHKVFVAFYVSASRSTIMSVFWGDALKSNITIGTTKSRVSFVANVGGGNNNLNLGFATNSGDELRVSYIIITDLTSAFGTTIADKAYTLEQSTSGSGIAWLKSYGFLTKDYYEYCQPSLESVRVSGHVMRDANDNIIGNYPLDSTLTLNGILKLSGDEITADGDVYGCDGTVTRNTIVRAYQSGDESLANAITDKTNTVVYSANASTETADGYTQIQFCDPDGTEAFVDYGVASGDRDVAIPAGHSTFYPEDLKGKLEDIPDIPEAPASNGTYTLKAVRSNSGVAYSWVSG